MITVSVTCEDTLHDFGPCNIEQNDRKLAWEHVLYEPHFDQLYHVPQLDLNRSLFQVA